MACSAFLIGFAWRIDSSVKCNSSNQTANEQVTCLAIRGDHSRICHVFAFIELQQLGEIAKRRAKARSRLSIVRGYG